MTQRLTPSLTRDQVIAQFGCSHSELGRLTPSLTRDQVIAQFGCSHSELGRLIRERRAPMPVRLDGAILWFADEIEEAKPDVVRLVLRRRGNFPKIGSAA